MEKMYRCKIWILKHFHSSSNIFITIVNQIWAGFLSNASLSWQKPWRSMTFIQRRRSVECKWGKYFCAWRPCSSQQVRVASTHVENQCVEVFQYASKHDYRILMNDAALIAVQNNNWSNRIFNVCNRPDLKSAWVRVFPLHCESRTDFCLLIQTQYKNYWLNLFSACYDEPPPVMHPGRTLDCIRWRKFRNVVISQVRLELAMFSRFYLMVESTKHYLKGCRHCGIRAERWTDRVQRHNILGAKGERTTPFSAFLT